MIPNLFIRLTSRRRPEKLWAAIPNPEFARQYWGGHVNISDWKKGSTWRHEYTEENNRVRVMGEVLESTPPKRLVITWFAPDNEADVSTVTFDIKPVKDLVRLDVVHSKLSADMARKVSGGWPLVLSSMKSYLETGKGLDIFAKPKAA